MISDMYEQPNEMRFLGAGKQTSTGQQEKVLKCSRLANWDD
jgi:hypothetical protein